ncbi:MAG: hypothetical protein MJ025_04605, partial [Victivallaceae bacterium]|nr:hypothetical protein [Victivallaceae bacterium]
YWGLFDRFHNVNRNYRSMEMIGTLVARYPRRVRTVVSGLPAPVAPDFKSVWMIAGLDESGRGGCLLVSDFRCDEKQWKIELASLSADAKVEVRRFDQNTPEPVVVATEIENGKLVLRKAIPGSCIWMVTFAVE